MGEDLSPQEDLTPKYFGPDGNEISTAEEMHQAIEAAAVRPAEQPYDAALEAEKDKALRERHPQPPLTEDDIAKLTAHRGKAPTQEEIAAMNDARARGIHTSIV